MDALTVVALLAVGLYSSSGCIFLSGVIAGESGWKMQSAGDVLKAAVLAVVVVVFWLPVFVWVVGDDTEEAS